ncbi:MAG: hypothetical protein ABIS84_01120 [Arachnia sp.]
MRVNLLHALGAEQPVLAHAEDLVLDLGLEPVISACADGDPVVREVVEATLLRPLTSASDILFRQDVMRDFVRHPALLRSLHDVTTRSLGAEREARRHIYGLTDRPESRLHSSVELLSLLLGFLRELRQLADSNAAVVDSDGVTAFLAATSADLSDDYLDQVAVNLDSLRFRSGIPSTVRLSPGNGIVDYRVDQPPAHQGRLREFLGVLKRSPFVVTIAPRDEAGATALRHMRDFSLNELADTLEHAATHVQGYLHRLHRETAFYVGALNLLHEFQRRHVVRCYPEPDDSQPRILAFTDLCDAGLALRGQDAPVTNDLDADGRSLILITGANSGGKSTFLRSVGLAQLLTQAGLPVPARTLRVSPAAQVLTHFKREEESSLISGKLDEELTRMSGLVPDLVPGSLVLFNESFASTYEAEGSEIARNVVLALTRRGMRVVYVTHMYQLGEGLQELHDEEHLFLRTTLRPDGRPSYRLHVGAPEPRSNGVEMYDRVFRAAGPTGRLPAA